MGTIEKRPKLALENKKVKLIFYSALLHFTEKSVTQSNKTYIPFHRPDLLDWRQVERREVREKKLAYGVG